MKLLWTSIKTRQKKIHACLQKQTTGLGKDAFGFFCSEFQTNSCRLPQTLVTILTTERLIYKTYKINNILNMNIWFLQLFSQGLRTLLAIPDWLHYILEMHLGFQHKTCCKHARNSNSKNSVKSQSSLLCHVNITKIPQLASLKEVLQLWHRISTNHRQTKCWENKIPTSRLPEFNENPSLHIRKNNKKHRKNLL